MLNLEVLRPIWGRFGIDFGSIFAPGSDSGNNENHRFSQVFWYSGVVVMACWGVLGIVLNVGFKMAFFVSSWG